MTCPAAAGALAGKSGGPAGADCSRQPASHGLAQLAAGRTITVLSKYLLMLAKHSGPSAACAPQRQRQQPAKVCIRCVRPHERNAADAAAVQTPPGCRTSAAAAAALPPPLFAALASARCQHNSRPSTRCQASWDDREGQQPPRQPGYSEFPQQPNYAEYQQSWQQPEYSDDKGAPGSSPMEWLARCDRMVLGAARCASQSAPLPTTICIPWAS